jgi:hypothetical protein
VAGGAGHRIEGHGCSRSNLRGVSESFDPRPRLDLERKARTQVVKIKRYVRHSGQRGLTERELELREGTAQRPANMSGAVTSHTGSTVLLVDALYWGLRVMIENMANDRTVTDKAEPFLLSL